MEGPRFLIAIVLSIAVVVIVNVMFPPTRPTERAGADSVRVDTVIAAPPDAPPDTPPAAVDTAAPTRRTTIPPEPDPVVEGAPDPEPGDTLWVETEVVRYGISTRGGALVSVELLGFESYTLDGPVQLVEPANGAILHYGIRLGDQVLPFDRLRFAGPALAEDTIRITEPTPLPLTASLNGADVQLTYRFAPGTYVVSLEGRIDGIPTADATLLLGLGPRLAVNEADSAEDLRALAYVVNSRQEGIQSVRVEDVETDRVEEGPLRWVALKNKYFLAAIIEAGEERAAFGGVLARGSPGGAESVQATFPLARDGAFAFRLFFGPQEQGRLSALGEGLQDVNPYGWRILRPIIRPLAHLITWLLTVIHNALGLGYGWVLILFGVAMRGILWPLNAKAMRSQLKTMELQPRIKEIQTKYKEKPELLQKEMVRLYKEEGFNPLGGCLPMFIPFPVLITLFFVFQNTIEFRGVEFLWLPDLSRPDPLYLLPVMLGASLFALQYMNMRAAPQNNPQQKMLMYFMPIMMTVIFLNFASGLNLYYAASNVASLPQQIGIIRERKKARARIATSEAT